MNLPILITNQPIQTPPNFIYKLYIYKPQTRNTKIGYGNLSDEMIYIIPFLKWNVEYDLQHICWFFKTNKTKLWHVSLSEFKHMLHIT